MVDRREGLRVALLAGTLGQGGAEKQLVYIARALHQTGVDVRVYSLTSGEFYESALRAIGLQPIWIGQSAHPLLRLAALSAALRHYRPHVLQAAHFHTNLYAALAGWIYRAMALGTIRNDTLLDLYTNGAWGPSLLRVPPVLLANSYTAKLNAESLGIKSDKIRILPNVIDLSDFDNHIFGATTQTASTTQPVAVAVARLYSEKRLERFLTALALAKRDISALIGILIGDGPERSKLESIADDLGLMPNSVQFLGRRSDVPILLAQARMLVVCSDHEGFPNVLLEGMAARLPVITTPAGDAEVVVREGVTGYVVPFNDVEGMAQRMVRLAKSPELCRQLGEAGRQRVEQLYAFEGLADRLLATYSSIAEKHGYRRTLRVLSS